MNREEAIKALKWFKEYNGGDYDGGDYDGGDRITDKYGDCYYLVTERDFEAFDMAIKALEQEPKKGHWIDGRCSKCGCDVPAYIVDWKWKKDMDTKFCPNCGAKMESEG